MGFAHFDFKSFWQLYKVHVNHFREHSALNYYELSVNLEGSSSLSIFE